MRIKNNTAFSLLEILLASFIFVISIAGVFATLNSVRTPVSSKEGSLTAAVFGKQVLEALRSMVSMQASSNYYTVCSPTCTDFSLAVGPHQVNSATLPAGLTWPPTLAAQNTVCDPAGCLVYTVTCADGTTGAAATCNSGGSNPDMARQVNLNISWQ